MDDVKENADELKQEAEKKAAENVAGGESRNQIHVKIHLTPVSCLQIACSFLCFKVHYQL